MIGPLSTGVTINQLVTDTSPAPLQQTGQPLDFGIAGDGYFAVRTPAGVRYTRDGQFTSNAQGLLVDGQGNPVLSQAGATITVSAKGTVPASALGVYNVTGVHEAGLQLLHRGRRRQGDRHGPARASSSSRASTRSTRWST